MVKNTSSHPCVFDLFLTCTQPPGVPRQTVILVCRQSVIKDFSFNCFFFRLIKDRTYNNTSVDEKYNECLHHRRTSSTSCWSDIGSSLYCRVCVTCWSGKDSSPRFVCFYINLHVTMTNDVVDLHKMSSDTSLDVIWSTPYDEGSKRVVSLSVDHLPSVSQSLDERFHGYMWR